MGYNGDRSRTVNEETGDEIYRLKSSCVYSVFPVSETILPSWHLLSKALLLRRP